jgi:hypothetical protein
MVEEIEAHRDVFGALREAIEAVDKWQMGVHRWQVRPD